MLPGEIQDAITRIAGYDRAPMELLEGVIAQLDVVLARGCNLWECCGHGQRCWARARDKPNRMHFRAPYIGPSYLSRRIVIVGMNSRDDGRMEAEYRTAADIQELFAAGHRRYGGLFHYRAGLLASLVAASQDGRALDLAPSAQQVAHDLRSIARVQAVQCAPGPEESRRTPTAAMWSACPPLTLARQLEVLKPAVIALLGSRTVAEVQKLEQLEIHWTIDWRRGANCFARGTARSGDAQCNIFGLYHPASAGWTRSVATLAQNLQASPLPAPPEKAAEVSVDRSPAQQ